MTTSVLVPWRSGCPWRQRAWDWVRGRYADTHPDWELVTGGCTDGPFNRAEAILDAASRSAGDILVVADADVWADPAVAVEQVDEHGWAIPHRLIHRLSQASTVLVLTGSDWQGLPLSEDNNQDRKPYKGNPTGTLVVLRRDLLEDIPPDARFVGWGSEDDAWGAALTTLAGKPWRGEEDLVHLWHPPQERQTRRVGNPESHALARRYLNARRSPALMRAQVEEAKQWRTTSASSASTMSA